MIEDFKITSYFIIDKMSLKKLSLLKGDENFFLGKKFGRGSLPIVL